MKNITLFVRDIPKGATADDLIDFIEGGIPQRMRLGSNYTINQPKILIVTNQVTMETHFHGLVTIGPEAFAERMIERLNLQPFMGRRVVVRRYHERRSPNAGRLEKMEEPVPDRRLEERRTSVGFEKLPFKVIHTKESKIFLFGGHFQHTDDRKEEPFPTEC